MDLSSPLRYLEMLTSDYSFFLVQEHGRIALLPLEVDYGRPRDLLWPIKCAGVPDVASGRSIFYCRHYSAFVFLPLEPTTFQKVEALLTRVRAPCLCEQEINIRLTKSQVVTAS